MQPYTLANVLAFRTSPNRIQSRVPCFSLMSLLNRHGRRCPCRLSGLDGEATEPVVKTISAQQQGDGDPQAEFAVASVLAEGGSCGLLLRLLSGGDGQVQRSLPRLLKLLQASCHLQVRLDS